MIAVLISNIANAQTYLINFTCTGAVSIVDSVKVENLTQGIKTTLLGSDILNLGSLSVLDKGINDKQLKVYPNPMEGEAEISFFAKQTANANISIFNITGAKVIQISEKLNRGINKYKISCLRQGIYLIYINSDEYTYATKLLSQNTITCVPKIEYLSGLNAKESVIRLKSTNATVNMAFNNGDLMRFTGYANNYYFVISLIPTTNLNITFDFTSSIASLTTKNATNIDTTTAKSGGNISNDGGALITERGICYNTSLNPTISNLKIICGNDTGTYIANMINLTPNTTYYVRAYAINNSGTAYGNQINFTTNNVGQLASLTTTSASNITATSASTGGNITSNGGYPVTSRGVCYNKNQNPTGGF